MGILSWRCRNGCRWPRPVTRPRRTASARSTTMAWGSTRTTPPPPIGTSWRPTRTCRSPCATWPTCMPAAMACRSTRRWPNSWYEKAARMGDPVAIKRMAALSPSGEFATAVQAATVEPAPAVEPMTVAGDDQVAEAVPVPVEPCLLRSLRCRTVVAAALEPEPAPEESAAAPTESPAQRPIATSRRNMATPDRRLRQPQHAGRDPAGRRHAAARASDPSNWLIGMWQGPSLGCPPDGGLEFAARRDALLLRRPDRGAAAGQIRGRGRPRHRHQHRHRWRRPAATSTSGAAPTPSSSPPCRPTCRAR